MASNKQSQHLTGAVVATFLTQWSVKDTVPQPENEQILNDNTDILNSIFLNSLKTFQRSTPKSTSIKQEILECLFKAEGRTQLTVDPC